MITIYYPSADQYFFLVPGGSNLAYGPIGQYGASCESLIEYRSFADHIKNQPGSLFHEKAVSHFEVHADLRCDEITPASEFIVYGAAKDAVRIRKFDGSYSIATMGLVGASLSARAWNAVSSSQVASEFFPGGFTAWNLDSVSYSNLLYVASVRNYEMSGIGSTQISIKMTRTTYAPSGAQRFVPFDWQVRQDVATVKEVVDRVKALPGVIPIVSVITYTVNLLRPYLTVLPTPSLLRAHLDTVIATRILSQDEYPELVEWGQLANEAASRVNRTDTNVLAFLRDLRHVKDLIPQLRSLRSLKGLSSEYLRWKYGILPTADDLRKIISAVTNYRTNRFGHQIVHSGSSATRTVGQVTYTTQQSLKLAVSSKEVGLSRLANTLDEFGVFPRFEYLWDLVPYSFVVDWFVQVGDYLSSVDTRLQTLRYDMLYTTMSVKQTAVQQFSCAWPTYLSGSMRTVAYHRWTQGQCPLPSLTSLNAQIGISDHWLEAAALIIQRKR